MKGLDRLTCISTKIYKKKLFVFACYIPFLVSLRIGRSNKEIELYCVCMFKYHKGRAQ